MSFTMFKMEGNIKGLNPADYQLVHEQMDYLAIDNLDEIPIKDYPFGHKGENKDEIPILVNEKGNSSKIWALFYQKNNFTNQFEIELPITTIAYKGKLLSLKGSGKIGIEGEIDVLGLCSMKQFQELLEEKVKNELLEGFKQEVKKKIKFPI